MNSGINPFFIIYSFADCGVSLPDCFSRELLWRHLDGILEARCWRGLGSKHPHAQDGGARVTRGSPYVHNRNDDPEGIVELLTLVHRKLPITARQDSAPVHKLHIAITDSHRVTTSAMGAIWHEARDLEDSEIPPFAVMDALTRILPYCRGGILEIRTNSVRILWGICGAPSGAWYVVRSVCNQHSVHLRAKWDESRGLSARLYAQPPRGAAPVPGRDADVVSAVVAELRVSEGSAGYRSLVDHLLR